MKKQILKNILVVLGISLFLSCENFLDENNIADVSAGSYYTTSQGLEDAVKATYGIMKEFYGTELGFSMNVFGNRYLYEWCRW